MIGFIEKIHKRNMIRNLKKKQDEVNRLYDKKGLSDKVLEKQLEINSLRYDNDIYDESELIFESYVQ